MALSFAAAQAPTAQTLNPYAMLSNQAQVLKVVGFAQQEVLLSTDALSSTAITQALKTAIEQHHVHVYVLVAQDGANDPTGLLKKLAVVGAQIRVGNAFAPFMIIDRTYTVMGLLSSHAPTGDTIASDAKHPAKQPTFLISEPGYVKRFSSMFISAFQQGRPILTGGTP